MPGGTTANTAKVLAKLGANVSFVGVVGDDLPGAALRASMNAAGIDTSWLLDRAGDPTDTCYIVVSGTPVDRTIFWRKGAKIVKGDPLDIPAIFGHDLVVLDFDDPTLLRFLTDLPAHTIPGTRLLGTLGYVPEFTGDDRFDVLFRCDALVGNEREYAELTGAHDLDRIIEAIRAGMPGANLRTAAISRGAEGATIVTLTERWDQAAYPVCSVDPTGAGDAFTAGMAWGMARRLPWSRTLELACACGALATRELGAQSALPAWGEIEALTGVPAQEWLE
jgi:ribokinase